VLWKMGSAQMCCSSHVHVLSRSHGNGKNLVLQSWSLLYLADVLKSYMGV
jgi:hypothetical protein